jgi:hypothetical protein
MTYTIYKISSPSHKAYVGVTRQHVSKRWQQHYQRALKTNLSHPFLQAIRKYGVDAFTVEVVTQCPTKEQALRLEVEHITRLNGHSYNLSPGGEYDCEAGVEQLKRRMQDKEWMRRYRERLSEGCRNSEKHMQRCRGELSELAAKWRKDNPRAAWKNVYRTFRLSLRALGVERGARRDFRFTQAGRLCIKSAKVAKARACLGRSDRVKSWWAGLDYTEKAKVQAAISKKAKERYRSMGAKEKKKADTQLSQARQNIDHDTRIRKLREAADRKWQEKIRGLPEEVVTVMAAKREKDRLRAIKRYYALKDQGCTNQ